MSAAVAVPITRQGARSHVGPNHASERRGFCRSHDHASALLTAREPGARVGGSRFLQVDPVEGGSCNDYDYVCGDPVNSYDLDGAVCLGKVCIRKPQIKAKKWWRDHGGKVRRAVGAVGVTAAVVGVGLTVAATGGLAAPAWMATATMATGLSAASVSTALTCGERRDRRCLFSFATTLGSFATAGVSRLPGLTKHMRLAARAIALSYSGLRNRTSHRDRWA